jgi:hypothetical protein
MIVGTKIEDLIGHPFGPHGPNIDNEKGKRKEDKSKQTDIKAKQKKEQCYKYSNKGKDQIHEAVILAGQPRFLKYENGEVKLVENIQEFSRVIEPPYPEEYPYEPYEFKDIKEAVGYADRAKKESIDSFYQKAKSIVEKYNDQDTHKQILLATDIVWSYFQDKFSTTHYLGVVGDNGSGKSTVGDTFEATGYRPVNMTDPTAANLFRLLGTMEAGQCTIIADEAEKIDQSKDIMGILKTGYHIKKKIAKTNTITYKQEFYFTYCFKMIISERLPHQSKAKGVLDRTLVCNTYKGNPPYDIKEILNPQGNPRRKNLLDELIEFRKLILIYRLIHFKDPICDIDVGLDGRDKELCKPVIQLFYNTEAQKEIESALQKFMHSKNQRKENTLEAILYPIIANLISQYGSEISVAQIWDSIKDNIEGKWDERKPNEYHAADYDMIYRNTMTNIICDKFGAEKKHKEKGNVLIFNPQKVARAGKVYNSKVSIQTKLIQNRPEDSEGSEGLLVVQEVCPDKDDKKTAVFNAQLSTESQNILENVENIFQLEDNRKAGTSPKPSGPSEQSATITEKESIYRLGHSDTWACKNCKQKDDKWFMQKHNCRRVNKT